MFFIGVYTPCMEQENIPPQNYEWQISTPPDEGEMFDSNALYSIPEFLRILRVIMNRHFDDPELGGMIEVMEIWEKKVLDLMGNDDGAPVDYLVGFWEDVQRVTRIRFELRTNTNGNNSSLKNS